MLDINKMFEKADKALGKKDFKKAIDIYKEIIKSTDTEAVFVARNLLGKLYESLGMERDAEKLYKDNIKEDFDGTHPYMRLAIMYKSQKRLEEELEILKYSIDFFGKLYSKDPDRVLLSQTVIDFKIRLDKALIRKNK